MRRFTLFLFLILAAFACANAGEISIAWDPSPSEGVIGYKAYYGPSSANYTETKDLGNVTQAKLTGLRTGNIYFIVVTAYDDEGTVLGSWDSEDNESGYSNEVSGTATKTVRVIAPPAVLRLEVN